MRRIESGQLAKPTAQILRKDQRTAAALHRAQLTELDCLIKGRSANARHGARLPDCIGQLSDLETGHDLLHVNGERGQP